MDTTEASRPELVGERSLDVRRFVGAWPPNIAGCGARNGAFWPAITARVRPTVGAAVADQTTRFPTGRPPVRRACAGTAVHECDSSPAVRPV